MLLNFFFNYIFKNDMNTNRTAIFNKTMFFGYMLYIFIYYFLGNKILFIVIFDNIYFLKNYLEMKEKPIDTNIISQNIIHKTILPKNKKKHFINL